MPIQKPIDIKDVPPAQKLGAKQSQVPEILKQLQKGKALPITNTYKETPTHKWKTTDQPRITTVRSYITKQHKKGHLTNIKMEQRVTYPQNTTGTKTITLYLIKE